LGWLIIACELMFWVFVLLGLFTRYVLKWKRRSALLFLCTILVDIGLLIVAIIDISDGEMARLSHALAAVYIGVSIVYGHRMIKWADDQFALRVMKISRPTIHVPKYGKEHAKYERRGWYRHFFSWAIGVSILLTMILLTGDFIQARELIKVALFWTIVLCSDFLWSFSYTIWPKRAPKAKLHR